MEKSYLLCLISERPLFVTPLFSNKLSEEKKTLRLIGIESRCFLFFGVWMLAWFQVFFAYLYCGADRFRIVLLFSFQEDYTILLLIISNHTSSFFQHIWWFGSLGSPECVGEDTCPKILWHVLLKSSSRVLISLDHGKGSMFFGNNFCCWFFSVSHCLATTQRGSTLELEVKVNP